MTYLAQTGDEFTADEVRHLLEGGPQPGTMNAYGGLFSSWRNRGLIVSTGYRKSTQRLRNGGAIAIWKGTSKAQSLNV